MSYELAAIHPIISPNEVRLLGDYSTYRAYNAWLGIKGDIYHHRGSVDPPEVVMGPAPLMHSFDKKIPYARYPRGTLDAEVTPSTRTGGGGVI